ncbi:long-chain fatty acid--CoA ligase [Paludibacter sp. 221]|uniref:AMP-binding protein n=1 Tax=Paludibacter sp. 221 TaxID=2302939 RepID=UPI0013D2889C|nr:AMP-binding protein [Paludibacter sp. 221]NDV47907.1 long-chain fatty acid--CoA ligase [Paludibacter sp. 221]
MIFSKKIEPNPLTIKSFFERTIKEFPQRPSVSFVHGEPLTYAELGKKVNEMANKLYSLGLKKGDKVALYGHNMPNWVIAYFAVATNGLVIVPILPDFTREEVENVLTHSESKVLFVSERLFTKVEGLKLPDLVATIKLDNLALLNDDVVQKEDVSIDDIEVAEDDIAALIYTSGTTGRSKGVVLTHKNITFVVMQSYSFQAIDEFDVFLSFLPLSHTYENSLGLLFPMMYGSSIYYMEKPPTAAALIPAMGKIKPTIMLSVPLIMEKLYKSQILEKFSKKRFSRMIYKNFIFRKIIHRIAGKKLYKTFGGRLKFFGIGGAKLDARVERFLKEAKFPYAIGYGLTETAPLLAGAAVGKTKLQSTGTALPGIDLKIHEPDKYGVGEIWAKGPNVMREYYKNPEATQEVLTDDGWFKTGDLGKFDKRKRLYIRGRAKTTIIGASGENIYPEDIESVINNDQFVTESLVVEEDGFLVAKIILNIDELETNIDNFKSAVEERKEKSKQTFHDLDERYHNWLQNYKKELNSRLNRNSQIKRIDVMDEPFEKTASQKIKRFLYTKSKDGKDNKGNEDKKKK